MPQIFNKFQVLLNPVLVEGISRVTLEAMSCGRVVIMLDYGNRYPVINAKTGFLIKNNLKDLIETLKYLYDNPKEIQKISLQSRQIVETEFSSKIIVPQIELLYSKVICESSI
jgi:glycosyltransferase involved in cell wall biosynthesis